jgi:hypothetical protein
MGEPECVDSGFSQKEEAHAPTANQGTNTTKGTKPTKANWHFLCVLRDLCELREIAVAVICS